MYVGVWACVGGVFVCIVCVYTIHIIVTYSNNKLENLVKISMKHLAVSSSFHGSLQL